MPYKKGHAAWNKGKTVPKEVRRRTSKTMKEYRKTHPPWNKDKTKETDERIAKAAEKLSGRKLSEEACRKMSEFQRNHPNSGQFKPSMIPWNKNLTKETDVRVRNGGLKIKGRRSPMAGRRHSEGTKQLMSERAKGREFTQEHRNNISKVMSSKTGELAHNWIDGRSFKPYPPTFNGSLKRQIRERDGNTCQICGRFGKCVHHIDYDKENCDPRNLRTLCRSCNGRVNGNRDFWQKFFGFGFRFVRWWVVAGRQ